MRRSDTGVVRPNRSGVSVVLVAILAAIGWSCSARVVAQRGDYLPLAEGSQWELRSRTEPDAMRLEVVGREGSAWIVNWVNPWIKAVFRFVKEGDDVHLTGLDMGQGMSAIPPDTIYWSFGPAQRRSVDERRGDAARHRYRVARGDAGRYLRERDRESRRETRRASRCTGPLPPAWASSASAGDAMPGCSPPSARAAGTATRREPERPAAAPPPPRRSPSSGSAAPLVGIDANPWDRASENDALQRGARRRHDRGPPRADVERHRALGRQVQLELLRSPRKVCRRPRPPCRAELPHRRHEQTGACRRTTRAGGGDDDKMVDRVRATLRAIRERTQARVRVLAIGNEVDGYFGKHQDEGDPVREPAATSAHHRSRAVSGRAVHGQLCVRRAA